ncbi:MAG: hypothetical protein RMJ87_06700 [Cytophagales bacterium]|nr:hypothetical protein [Bernardetiaceae bacterium]MDW8204701.1 hypothetical protein [Cytophagales bacterium]
MIVLVGGAAAILPFLLLCYYTVPAYIDDYGIAVHIQQFGAGFIPYYLKTWNGRFVAAFFHWLNPLGYRLPEWYGLTALFLLSFFGFSLWVFISNITGNYLAKSERWVAWAVFMTFFLAYIRSTVDLFYWYSSGATYCIAICWQLLYLSLLPQLFRQNSSRYAMPGIIVLAFLQAGTNEVVVLPTFILTAALLVVLVQRKNSRWQWAALSLVVMLAGIFLQIALSDSPRSHSVMRLCPQWDLLMKGLQMHMPYVLGWFKNLPLLAALFLLLPIMSDWAKQTSTFVFAHKRSLLLLLSVSVAIIIAILAAYLLFNRDLYIPKRIENIAYLWWLFSVFAIALATVQHLWLRYKFSFDKLPGFLIVAMLLFIAGKIFSANTKVGLAWKVLLNGDAYAYRSEYQQRVNIMQRYRAMQYQDTVLIPPVRHPMELIFHQDLYGYAPGDGNNHYFAAYFGLKAVKVDSLQKYPMETLK